MKVSVKTLKGSTFQIEANQTDTIADLKKSIETIKGSDVYPAAQQMLVHQGKVLEDETSLEDNKVGDNSSIVIMTNKNKRPPAQRAAADPVPLPASVAAPAADPVPASNLVPGSISGERAVENLYSGVPEVSPAALDLFPSNANFDSAGDAEALQALRGMILAHPEILEPMAQELGRENPDLMGLIQEHDYFSILNEHLEGQQRADAVPRNVTVTAEEREAIERLQAMGFDPPLVLQVFFACDKNEQLAANFLLDHMHD